MKIKQSICLALAVMLTLSIVACSGEPESSNAVAVSDSLADKDNVARYTCSMHPHYISTDSEGSCPICGMELVPIASSMSMDNASESGEHNTDMVSDQIEVTVSKAMIQTMGVRTEPAQVIEFGRSLRAFGTVEADERLENVSVSRLEGWIEDLNVSAEGDSVKSGDLLYRIYSPELIATQRDYLNALSSGSKKRIGAVKQRLFSNGMQAQAVQQLNQRKITVENVPVYAETDGVVAELNVRDGDYIKPGTPILRLQSYEQVWVIASIPETDLPLIESGITANLRFPSAPSAAVQGAIDYIYPTVDPKTRTGKVRIEVENAGGQLLPGAYADITLEFGKQDRLSIVSESILRDSRGDHAIVALGEGRFASRAVTIGISAQGRTEIINGLQAGDLVVASGQFMLDSEVNLREGLSKLSASAPSSESTTEPSSDMTAAMKMNEAPQPLSTLKPDADTLAQIDHFVDMALYIHETLLKGDSIDPSFAEPAIFLADSLSERFAGTELELILRNSQQVLSAAKTALEGDALATELDRLMQAIEPWLLEGAPQHYSDLGLKLYREIDTGRLWLQISGEALNPYGDSDAELVSWLSASDADSDSHADHQ